MSEEEAAALLPDLQRRIRTHKVSFDDVADCYFKANPVPSSDPATPKLADAITQRRQLAYAALGWRPRVACGHTEPDAQLGGLLLDDDSLNSGLFGDGTCRARKAPTRVCWTEPGLGPSARP